MRVRSTPVAWTVADAGAILGSRVVVVVAGGRVVVVVDAGGGTAMVGRVIGGMVARVDPVVAGPGALEGDVEESITDLEGKPHDELRGIGADEVSFDEEAPKPLCPRLVECV